ncbi:MAG: tetratricopeptide repeat protein [Anaerolineales bacterium]|nr:tetratricopeptide repeat protein [Anaerolineales bacterium]
MTEPTINSLLKKAESHALNSDWLNSIAALQQVLQLEPQHAAANFTLGTLLMETGSPAEAISYLRACILTTPDHEEASVSLAKALAQTNKFQEAERILTGITGNNPENRSAWNALSQILILQDNRISEAVQILAALVQTDPTDPDALYLMGKVYESVEDTNSALEMYHQILRHHPSEQRAQAALQGLGEPTTGITLPSVCFIGPPTFSTENRLGLPARELSGLGYPVSVHTSWDQSMVAPDIFVFSEPHSNPVFLEAFLQSKAAGKKAFVNLDLHYPSLTSNHPRYHESGPGNPEGIQALEHILDSADMLLTSSQALSDAYQKPGRPIQMFPPVWNPGNELWHKPPEKREKIHLGLIGSQLQKGDAEVLKGPVETLFDLNENLMLMVLEDFSLLDLFSGINEQRKLFLPAGRFEDYPYQLSHIDILLIPGGDSPIHQTRSDRPLLEAGIRRIPWVASPCPSFKDWHEGGILIEKPLDWLSTLENLIAGEELRSVLGEAGSRQAQSRTIRQSISRWQELIRSVL